MHTWRCHKMDSSKKLLENLLLNSIASFKNMKTTPCMQSVLIEINIFNPWRVSLGFHYTYILYRRFSISPFWLESLSKTCRSSFWFNTYMYSAWTICPRGYFISVFHKYEFSILLFRLLQYRYLLCSIPTKQQVPRASSTTVLSEWYMNNTRGPNVVPEALMWRDEDEQKENPKWREGPLASAIENLTSILPTLLLCPNIESQ